MRKWSRYGIGSDLSSSQPPAHVLRPCCDAVVHVQKVALMGLANWADELEKLEDEFLQHNCASRPPRCFQRCFQQL
jgi:hypothetical protein